MTQPSDRMPESLEELIALYGADYLLKVARSRLSSDVSTEDIQKAVDEYRIGPRIPHKERHQLLRDFVLWMYQEGFSVCTPEPHVHINPTIVERHLINPFLERQDD